MSIRRVAVCGAAGTMGAGIAMVSARAGFPTYCYDLSASKLEDAALAARDFFDSSVERGKMSQEERDAALSNLIRTTKLEDLADADLVIEAVFEDLSAKQKLLKALDDVCRDTTIFASNTSTLSITEIASGCSRETQVVGMHFCLPAERMKLIEMSRGINTNDETFDLAWRWTQAAGQLAVETQDKPGFILNALLVPFNNDVLRAVEAGLASPADIDKAITVGLGYKMGPCSLLDMVGYDTQALLCEAFYPVTLESRSSAPPLLRRMVAAGHLGNKNGKGLRTGDEGSADASASVGAVDPFAVSVHGESRSFPEPNKLLQHAEVEGEIVIHLGGGFVADSSKRAVLVELDLECLGEHTGEDRGQEGSNVLGFARYRNGNDAPTNLIEVVRQPQTDPTAIAATKSLLESLGYSVSICADMPGRIIDRLVRPKYNAALRFLDEGLASADAMDQTCTMGLGYVDGPIERVVRGGLARHYEISANLFAMTGHPAYVPARRAFVAHARERKL